MPQDLHAVKLAAERRYWRHTGCTSSRTPHLEFLGARLTAYFDIAREPSTKAPPEASWGVLGTWPAT
jgi:hypothetical protein